MPAHSAQPPAWKPLASPPPLRTQISGLYRPIPTPPLSIPIPPRHRDTDTPLSLHWTKQSKRHTICGKAGVAKHARRASLGPDSCRGQVESAARTAGPRLKSGPRGQSKGRANRSHGLQSPRPRPHHMTRAHPTRGRVPAALRCPVQGRVGPDLYGPLPQPGTRCEYTAVHAAVQQQKPILGANQCIQPPGAQSIAKPPQPQAQRLPG